MTTKLSNLSIEQLQQVCSQLELETEDLTDKVNGHLRLVRRVLNHVNSEEVQDSNDGGMTLLQTVCTFIKGIGFADSKPKETSPAEPPKTSTDSKALRLLRREPGQKDRITFASLANQIETRREKGYTDRDIVHAVIRAIAPGSKLRSYLEGRNKIPLPSLRRIIRSHYQENDVTELFKQLSQLAQISKETPPAFLLRAFNIRQKVLFASQEVESKLCYEPNLMREMFRHIILTGLRSDTIRAELRPYLDDAETLDEVLFEKMNVFSSLED